MKLARGLSAFSSLQQLCRPKYIHAGVADALGGAGGYDEREVSVDRSVFMRVCVCVCVRVRVCAGCATCASPPPPTDATIHVSSYYSICVSPHTEVTEVTADACTLAALHAPLLLR